VRTRHKIATRITGFSRFVFRSFFVNFVLGAMRLTGPDFDGGRSGAGASHMRRRRGHGREKVVPVKGVAPPPFNKNPGKIFFLGKPNVKFGIFRANVV